MKKKKKNSTKHQMSILVNISVHVIDSKLHKLTSNLQIGLKYVGLHAGLFCSFTPLSNVFFYHAKL